MAKGNVHGKGGVHGEGGACVAKGGACVVCTSPRHSTRYGRSMRGRYASYWNAFLLKCKFYTFKQ